MATMNQWQRKTQELMQAGELFHPFTHLAVKTALQANKHHQKRLKLVLDMTANKDTETRAARFLQSYVARYWHKKAYTYVLNTQQTQVQNVRH